MEVAIFLGGGGSNRQEICCSSLVSCMLYHLFIYLCAAVLEHISDMARI